MNSDNLIRLIEKILSNSASGKESEQFNSWLGASDNHHRFNYQVKAIWDKLYYSNKEMKFDEAAALTTIILKVKQNTIQKRVLFTRFRIAAAASILVLFSIGYLVFSSGKLTDNMMVYETGDNEILEVVLPDSTRVCLNRNSKLFVSKRFNKHQRKLILEGEAYFTVTRNEQKVFKAITGNTITKVLGTSFNLKYNETKNVQLIVNSGLVQFYNKKSLKTRSVLSAAEKGEYNASGHVITKKKNTDKNYLSWKTGVLTFSNTPLDEVCRDLANHYMVKIESVIGDPVLTLTGTFNNENLDDIITTISLTLDLNVTSSASGIVLTK